MTTVFKRTQGLTEAKTHYCPGCTHGIVHRLVGEVLEEMGLLEEAIAVVPVGCAVMATSYFNTDGIQAAHGRAPATATGVKRVHPDNTVFTYQGDGDLASIGTAEIIHAAARGEKITTIFINNGIYGMTGGQMAPTTLPGMKATTCQSGRDPKIDGNPIRVSEMLSTLEGAAYIQRVAVNSPFNVIKARKAIQKAFEDKGVHFEMNVQTEEIENAGSEAVVHYKKEGTALTAGADAVLIATGRKPNTEGLNLEAAGVEKTPRGAVKVDEKLRTSVPNIWAMGDVAGGLQFTYVSLDDFRIVKDQLTGSGKRASSDRTVPYSVFIDPPFSRVGLNEEEAAAQGYHVKIAKLPAAAIPKAQVLRKPVGLLKAVIDADTNKILGTMLFCEESYEMINIVKLAMDAGLDYTVLRDQIFTHPTMSEALNDLFAV